MIIRRIATAIKRQDWFVVLIEIVIVVLGVYIGIYLGDIQAERKLQADTNIALQAFEDELRSDLARLEEVIAVQRTVVGSQVKAKELLGEPTPDEAAIGMHIKIIYGNNDTFFPNRSAYGAMQTEGFLAALTDQDLRLKITRLVEREYNRAEFNSSQYDDMIVVFGLRALVEYWEFENNRFVQGDPAAATKLQTGISLIHDLGDFYLRFISTFLREEMIETLEMIDAYQERQQ